MTFKIVVCIKQVPDTSDIKWTEHNTIQRDGLDSIINPFDVGAIQLAKNVKILLKKMDLDVQINVVTMGPLQAVEMLKKAVAMGCDKAFLLSDKKFSGADTLATAYTLSLFIKTQIPDFNLVICGQQAIDGDTAQTPSSLAQKLSVAQITNVVALKEANNVYSVWIKDSKTSTEEIKTGHPALIATTLKNTNILPNINGYIKACKTKITVLNSSDLNIDINKIGLVGSPTQVKKAYKFEILRNTTYIENESAENCSEYIIDEINKCRVNDD